LIAAEKELFQLVDREGEQGEDVERLKKLLRRPVKDHSLSRMERMTGTHLLTLSCFPHMNWKLKYGKQFPLLMEPAIRVALM